VTLKKQIFVKDNGIKEKGSLPYYYLTVFSNLIFRATSGQLFHILILSRYSAKQFMKNVPKLEYFKKEIAARMT